MKIGQIISPRQAFGEALAGMAGDENIVALDPEVGNSTYLEDFKKAAGSRYFEMYIAEQNAVGVAVGLARRNKKPVIASFAAFWTRAFDQIRMAQYARVPLLIAGTHSGISVGEDGTSQMGLEDVAMFRSLRESLVVCPADGMAAMKLTENLIREKGIKYLRLFRSPVETIYGEEEYFQIGKCKMLKASDRDQAVVIASGICVHEALKAFEKLNQENVIIRIIDLYSIKPFDEEKVWESAVFCKNVIVVEDHYEAGGVGEGVGILLAKKGFGGKFEHLCVRVEPHSGRMDELLKIARIDSEAIINAVKKIIK